jgi:molecular chaperone DnaJ
MAAINEAYRVLSDAGRRAVYDRALDGPTGSAVPPSHHRATEDRAAVRSPTYNYPDELAPARVPWKLLGVMASIGIGFVLAGAVLIDSPEDPAPDGIIRSGSCVEIEANNDAREVACTGDGDLVVDQLVPIDARCPGGTAAYRDRQGLGIACVIRNDGS